MEIRILSVLITLFGGINLIRMAFFLIGSDIYGLIAHNKRRVKKLKTPTFTVVIPAHNEELTIVRAITSVVGNSYPGDKVEILVVDDGSTDSTVQIVEDYIASTQANITLLTQQNSGKARALNKAIIHHSTGELVMCLDSDSYLDSHALRNAAAHFSDPKVSALAANVKIIPRKGLLNLIQRYEYLICYQMKRAESLFNIEYIVGGIGSVFRRSVLTKVGYYDFNTVTEDIDLTMKILQMGNKDYKTAYGADVISYTESVFSVQELIKQRFRWKWGRSQTFLKNKNMFFSNDRRYTKGLSWLYLPFALYGDLAYFLEPILLAYILYVTILFQDPLTIMSAWTVISLYISINILAEDTMSFKEKVVYLLGAPLMYGLFYILSFVEYAALIKALFSVKRLPQSLVDGPSTWEHVNRSAANQSSLLIRPVFAVVVLILIIVSVLGIDWHKNQQARVEWPETEGEVMSEHAVQEFYVEEKALPTPTTTPIHTYTIANGDSRWRISTLDYGHRSEWRTLLIPQNPENLHPGQVLLIP